MSANRRGEIGRLGERLAARRLERDGYKLVERNFRTRWGEIDLIAQRGSTLVFCEVKTLVARGGGTGPANPLDSVRSQKRAQVRRMARAWLGERGAIRCRNVRFDAIGVLVSPAGRPLRIEHVEAAF